jgi:hypothetical protein
LPCPACNGIRQFNVAVDENTEFEDGEKYQRQYRQNQPELGSGRA